MQPRLHGLKRRFRTTPRWVALIAVFLADPSFAQERARDAGGGSEAYRRAIAYLPWQRAAQIDPGTIRPDWTREPDALVYERGGKGHRQCVRVRLRPPYEVTPGEPGKACPQAAGTALPAPAGQLVSPGGRWRVEVRGGNLYRIDAETGESLALTRDAVPDYGYGGPADADLRSLARRMGLVPARPWGRWSPDGNRLLTYRVDERGFYKLPIVVPIVAGARHQIPWVHFQNSAFPQAGRVPRAEMMIFEMRSGARVDLDIPAPLLNYDPTPDGGAVWSGDGTKVYLGPETPDYRTMQVFAVDAATGRGTRIASDHDALALRPDIGTGKRFWPIPGAGHSVLYSRRSGWGHLYLYDDASGKPLRAITQGRWAVQGVVRLDARTREVYFLASGRDVDADPDPDPFAAKLYRVGLDGGEPRLLTPEAGHHDIAISPDGRYLVDSFSGVDRPAVTVLRAARSGAILAQLAQGEVQALAQLGWSAPRRFTVKAADGRTDIHGVLFLPGDFDPAKTYPLVDAQYASPARLRTPRRFLEDRENAMALAQAGFVVMMMDGRAAPFRDQALQDLSFGNQLAAPQHLADHVTAIRQLARRFSFIDGDRVGIYGHSAGGFQTVRAMAFYPEVFKAGIATAGSHDYKLFVSAANRYLGDPASDPQAYGFAPNTELAPRIEGRLMLVHGALDDDVNIAQTLQMAQALEEANRDFDLLILPDRNHKNLWGSGYLNRKVWDFFTRNLKGEEPPAPIRVPDDDRGPFLRPD